MLVLSSGAMSAVTHPLVCSITACNQRQQASAAVHRTYQQHFQTSYICTNHVLSLGAESLCCQHRFMNRERSAWSSGGSRTSTISSPLQAAKDSPTTNGDKSEKAEDDVNARVGGGSLSAESKRENEEAWKSRDSLEETTADKGAKKVLEAWVGKECEKEISSGKGDSPGSNEHPAAP